VFRYYFCIPVVFCLFFIQFRQLFYLCEFLWRLRTSPASTSKTTAAASNAAYELIGVSSPVLTDPDPAFDSDLVSDLDSDSNFVSDIELVLDSDFTSGLEPSSGVAAVFSFSTSGCVEMSFMLLLNTISSTVL
jgi:hypothetical protein